MEVLLSRSGRKQQLGMGLGPGRVVTLNTPHQAKAPRGGTWLFAEAPLRAGSHCLGPGGPSRVFSASPAVRPTRGRLNSPGGVRSGLGILHSAGAWAAPAPFRHLKLRMKFQPILQGHKECLALLFSFGM